MFTHVLCVVLVWKGSQAIGAAAGSKRQSSGGNENRVGLLGDEELPDVQMEAMWSGARRSGARRR